MANPLPTLVQHVHTAMDQNAAAALILNLPNAVLSNNALICWVQFKQPGSTTVAISDNKSNTWVAGPALTVGTVVLSLFYALNCAANTRTVTATFTGTQPVNPQMACTEFYNVGSAADGSTSASGTSPFAAGSFTPTTDGDLIYHCGVDTTAQGALNVDRTGGAAFTAGAGYTLLSACLQVGAFAQYQIQTTAAAINPSCSLNSGSDTFASIAIALKAANNGTAPALGIRIIRVYHWWGGTPSVDATAATIQFPTSGNLFVGMNATGKPIVTNVTDSMNNTWDVSHSQQNGIRAANVIYAANAASSPTLKVSFNTFTTTGGSGHSMFVMFDITGAHISPFDSATGATGDAGVATTATFATIAPTTINGLVFDCVAVQQQSVNSVNVPNVLDSIVNPSNHNEDFVGTPASNLDEDNAYAHLYNPTTASVSFTYTSAGVQGYGLWASMVIAFKAAPVRVPLMIPSIGSLVRM